MPYTPFTPYNDLSDFTFYKPGITNFGIQALLIFDENGLPILSRYYDNVIQSSNDNDDNIRSDSHESYCSKRYKVIFQLLYQWY